MDNERNTSLQNGGCGLWEDGLARTRLEVKVKMDHDYLSHC